MAIGWVVSRPAGPLLRGAMPPTLIEFLGVSVEDCLGRGPKGIATAGVDSVLLDIFLDNQLDKSLPLLSKSNGKTKIWADTVNLYGESRAAWSLYLKTWKILSAAWLILAFLVAVLSESMAEGYPWILRWLLTFNTKDRQNVCWTAKYIDRLDVMAKRKLDVFVPAANHDAPCWLTADPGPGTSFWLHPNQPVQHFRSASRAVPLISWKVQPVIDTAIVAGLVRLRLSHAGDGY